MLTRPTLSVSRGGCATGCWQVRQTSGGAKASSPEHRKGRGSGRCWRPGGSKSRTQTGPEGSPETWAGAGFTRPGRPSHSAEISWASYHRARTVCGWGWVGGCRDGWDAGRLLRVNLLTAIHEANRMVGTQKVTQTSQRKKKGFVTRAPGQRGGNVKFPKISGEKLHLGFFSVEHEMLALLPRPR